MILGVETVNGRPLVRTIDIVCKVERRAVTHQLNLLYDDIQPELYIAISVHTAVNKHNKTFIYSRNSICFELMIVKYFKFCIQTI